MLEKFQKIYDVHDKAGPEDWKALSEWLEKNKFQNVNLPENYVLLMEESNGGIYVSGKREYQFLSLKEIPEYYEAYMFSKFMPFAFPFAMDGCGNFYLFNLRQTDKNVYGVSAGNLGWGQDEYFQIANNFEELISQKHSIEPQFN